MGHDQPHDPGDATAPSAHESSEGFVLARTDAPAVAEPRFCPDGAAVRAYDVAAIHVEITLNRFLDHDPLGLMYVLEGDLERVRDEEARNRAARDHEAEPAVTVGLQGDAIQPLVLRVNQGECLRIHMRNGLDEQLAGIEVHGAGLYLSPDRTPARATDPASLAQPGERVTYEWWVAESESEGTRYLHSHGDARWQSGHGLFGAVVVEPAGSLHLAPETGEPLASGWSAIIVPPGGPSFREFVFFYHEIGDERYRHKNAAGNLVVQVDPYTGAYRPGDRAINYRSEPFMNRMELQRKMHGHFDESLAYSSYAFGDPATPIARSYLGDPVKQRLVHGGSEVFHVHHVHGGATRWNRQPGADASRFAIGLDKHPPLLQASTRLDSQAAGPSETFDIETECGSGGCQQGAGDYLIHCHIAHHYFAGMWTIWRVYNTLQDDRMSQDDLPPLRELPDRAGGVRSAVTSSELAGSTVDWMGREFDLAEDELGEWVERQLPPRGIPAPDDASVFDWAREGDLYLNEPDSTDHWPGYASAQPGRRVPLSFDPITGKLAYPWLRPHLGKRPPFAPNHGPAPFLEPLVDGHGPAPPGANGPWSLCPDGTTPRTFTIHAVSLPVVLNERIGLVDPVGQLFVLKEHEEALRADPSARVPLAIRSNAGEDCIDILFKSELPDARSNAFHSKANIHIHFVQFDVQASDGLTAGFNYEQSVRPFTVEGEPLTEGAGAGTESVAVPNPGRFHPGALVGIGMDQDATFEVRRVVALEQARVVLDAPLQHDHQVGEIVSSEFVRYRWYPDVQFGTAYFHDHVSGLTSWQHGLFGALIAEPPGSTYHDPHTGNEISSGLIADIHTSSPVSVDVTGSFRELVLLLQDDNPLTRLQRTTGSSLNLRVEPLTAGGRGDRGPTAPFRSDPETPVIEAHLGDPLVIRSLVAGTNDMHTLNVSGHWFRLDADSPTSPPIDTVAIGISERADLVIPGAGGPQAMPGDYLIRSGRASKLLEGSWGILRVYGDGAGGTLRVLPGRSAAQAAERICPEEAPLRPFYVSALEIGLPMLDGAAGKVLVPTEHVAAVASGRRAAEPWVVHVNVGDCIEIQISNRLGSDDVSLHAGMLAADPDQAVGLGLGRDPARAVAPGAIGVFTFYAHPGVGETVALVTGGVDPVRDPASGLYGAIVVGAAGTRYTDPVRGDEAGASAGWRVDAHPPDGASYRAFTLFLHDEDTIIGTAIMPYNEHVQGAVGINYAAEPLASRAPSGTGSFTSFGHSGREPSTPLLEAFEGDAVRIHVLVASGEQPHVFAVEGHRWALERGLAGTNLVSSRAIGPLEASTVELLGGAGPAGEYVYGDHREPYRAAGLWGLLRIHAVDATVDRLSRLPRP